VRKIILVCAGVIIFTAGSAMAGTWTTYDKPGATYYTSFNGIDGDNIAGSSSNGNFLYNMTSQTWTSLNVPGTARHISGSYIVGFYGPDLYKGFLYNGTAWTMLKAPEADITYANGVDSTNVVGSYRNASSQDWYGFLYNGTDWTTLSIPVGWSTQAFGIDGSNIVGQYSDASNWYHGFLYNGTTWTILDMPGALRTYIQDICGSNLVGYYWDAASVKRGFLYDGTTWTTLDAPGAIETYAYSISGDNIVGYYKDTAGKYHGFIYEIPEPATVLLIGLGGLMLRKRR
jgi:hypothetical protein